jgi:hypothetical protein
MLTSSVILLHDYVCQHTAAHAWALLGHFNWELFLPLPPYIPDVMPSDCHLFTYLNSWLWSQHFNNNEELMEGVETWLSSQAYRNLFPNMTSPSVLAVIMLRSSLIVYIFFLISCAVNSSPVDTSWIALVLRNMVGVCTTCFKMREVYILPAHCMNFVSYGYQNNLIIFLNSYLFELCNGG